MMIFITLFYLIPVYAEYDALNFEKRNFSVIYCGKEIQFINNCYINIQEVINSQNKNNSQGLPKLEEYEILIEYYSDYITLYFYPWDKAVRGGGFFYKLDLNGKIIERQIYK